jgi:hypothetical protein
MARVEVEVQLDLPEGVELLGYERSGDGHGFEVKFPLPDFCRCEKCGHEEVATYGISGQVLTFNFSGFCLALRVGRRRSRSAARRRSQAGSRGGRCSTRATVLETAAPLTPRKHSR